MVTCWERMRTGNYKVSEKGHVFVQWGQHITREQPISNRTGPIQNLQGVDDRSKQGCTGTSRNIKWSECKAPNFQSA